MIFPHGLLIGRWRTIAMSVVIVDALAARRHFLCLCKESDQRRAFQQPKAGQAHPGPRAPAAKRLGFVLPVGIFGRHIRVPAQNAAHRARRPAGLPTIATAEDGAPKSRAKAKALQVPRPRHLVVAFAVVLASRAPVRAWQAGRVNPQGGAQGCAPFSAGAGGPFRKFPGRLRTLCAQRAGHAARGVLSFGYFSLHKQRKVTPAEGAPSLVTNIRHRASAQISLPRTNLTHQPPGTPTTGTPSPLRAKIPP